MSGGETLRVRTRCPGCKAWMERSPVKPLPKGWECGRCTTGVPLRGAGSSEDGLKKCVVCDCSYFYVEKDFPKPLRFFFLGLAILLSFFTYGTSLFVFAAIDWLLFQFLPYVRICYLCEAEYRGFPNDPELKPFDPHKGVAYDARRAVPDLETLTNR